MGKLHNEMFHLKMLINSSYSIIGDTNSRLYEKYEHLKFKSRCIEVRKLKIKKIFNV